MQVALRKALQSAIPSLEKDLLQQGRPSGGGSSKAATRSSSSGPTSQADSQEGSPTGSAAEEGGGGRGGNMMERVAGEHFAWIMGRVRFVVFGCVSLSG